MNFAIYQMEVIPGNPAENRQKVKRWIEEVTEAGKVDTVVLPEMWTTSYTLTDLHELADKEGEQTKAFLKEQAVKHKINIVGGSVANNKGGHIYNSSFVFNAKGELVHEYDKIHLVPMLNEHLYLKGGQKSAETFELNGIKMGLIICYDLRFPELIRSLALDGAQVLFVVAEWPTARKNHWVALQVARAIENQMYVVSSNCVGTCDEVDYAGTSMIIDPWGDVLKQGTENEETLIETLDLEKVAHARKDVPIFSSRVPSLYKFN
ncbi:MAG: carbon-nitrogen family hydrolase [Bacillota bacterium]